VYVFIITSEAVLDYISQSATHPAECSWDVSPCHYRTILPPNAMSCITWMLITLTYSTDTMQEAVVHECRGGPQRVSDTTHAPGRRHGVWGRNGKKQTRAIMVLCWCWDTVSCMRLLWNEMDCCLCLLSQPRKDPSSRFNSCPLVALGVFFFSVVLYTHTKT
jgi:hypothetical protein